jgi:hypothetical protein
VKPASVAEKLRELPGRDLPKKNRIVTPNGAQDPPHSRRQRQEQLQTMYRAHPVILSVLFPTMLQSTFGFSYDGQQPSDLPEPAAASSRRTMSFD